MAPPTPCDARQCTWVRWQDGRVDLLLWALLTIGALVVVGSYFLVRKLPRDIRPVAIVPLVVVFVA